MGKEDRVVSSMESSMTKGAHRILQEQREEWGACPQLWESQKAS